MIKVCVDPQCEAVYHDIDKKQTRCKDCGGWIIEINKKTYLKKYKENWFQYDSDHNYFRPTFIKQLNLFE